MQTILLQDLGENILDKYQVKLVAKAARDLDGIYGYIAMELKERGTAEKLVDLLEEAILSLSEMPYRGVVRKFGAYASKGYRQIFVKNFIIVYRIDESSKTVIIVAVRYSPSNF